MDNASSKTIVKAGDGYRAAKDAGWRAAGDIFARPKDPLPVLQDGPSVYGYAGQSPLYTSDMTGLAFNGFINPPSVPIDILKCGRKRSKKGECLICGGPNGGALSDIYCAPCFGKSQDSSGGVPPIVPVPGVENP